MAAAADPLEELKTFCRKIDASLRAAEKYLPGWCTCEELSWGHRKILFIFQLAVAIAYCWLAFVGPLPGYAIALLGFSAALMAYRSDASSIEKTVWIVVIFALLILELFAIRREHARQDATSAQIIRETVKVSSQIALLQNVPRNQTAPSQVILRPKQRSYVEIDAHEVGINTAEGPQKGKLFVNVRCSNAGQVIVSHVDCGASVYVYEGKESEILTNRALEKTVANDYFRNFIAQHKPATINVTINPGQFRWWSPLGPIATQDLIEQLNTGEKVLFVVGKVLYRDEGGQHWSEMCEWMQPPLSPMPVWHGCSVHLENH